ncbi:MAG: type II toxin-antitoxin system HicA family toxin [Coriobacteriales bacterium]|jgi:predicted RNA binding protein YcfA (HicA-like mRNA interferase family)|nr:type II toxin-antitoxin system HicA family toxin [Coriobacteriales bacterium]
MVRRRDVVKELTQAGFESRGGTNHEKFKGNGRTTMVPRHNEIGEALYKRIRKQAGLE